MHIQCLQVGEIGTNCYLVRDEASREAAVIDPGGEPERIIAALEKAGCVPGAVFLTHGHYDHTGGVAGLMARWPETPVYLNSRDFPGEAPYLRRLFPPVPGTRDCGEGDVFTAGGLTFSVLETPGHSEGSVTLRCGDVLFCGDTLFAGSCGRTDFPGGDIAKIMASLKRLGELEGDLTVYPGHMEPSTLERERRTNPYLRRALAGGTSL